MELDITPKVTNINTHIIICRKVVIFSRFTRS